ncbi:hypothetical protein [Oceanobacillus iheyensis HTE831]|uniref:Uncharacterized protein n=1 Tax=Oceanobacillus iheyensis (strain DSM 14371 / CIP 107618 / JCM 11309 / KCTC 3954 / HTE831) TaxID=221109 RepID=Q8EU01_OCEIH|nr:hypothetical protein [Oceanobacillus iheyensis HTE831]
MSFSKQSGTAREASLCTSYTEAFFYGLLIRFRPGHTVINGRLRFCSDLENYKILEQWINVLNVLATSSSSAITYCPSGYLLTISQHRFASANRVSFISYGSVQDIR